MEIGKASNDSMTQVKRYIRLTYLIPDLLEMVDQKRIGFNPAVELSYLRPKEQREALEAIEYTQSTPSLSQAQRFKGLSQEGACTFSAMRKILGEPKKSELGSVTLKHDQIQQYFPKSYSPKQMENTILKLLEQWKRRREQQIDR